MARILIPVAGEHIAPRFDVCTEAWIGRVDELGKIVQERMLVLAHASAEDMCQLAMNEHVDVVICNGIEGQYFDYLQWKKIQVIDSVIGTVERVLESLARKDLTNGVILT